MPNLALKLAVYDAPEPLRLHIGGQERKAGWKILDVEPRPEVDYIGTCTDLSQFADKSTECVYLSHVLEHLSHDGEVQQALKEFHRVLVPGGKCYVAVPNFAELCRLYTHPDLTAQERWVVMCLMFGGHRSPHDVHKVGLSYEFLRILASQTGFSTISQVREFGIFNDSSYGRILGDNHVLTKAHYSLNVILTK